MARIEASRWKCLALAILVSASSAQPASAGQSERLQSTGSGFLVNDAGLFVTNFHVVEGATRIEVFFPSLNAALPAVILASDEVNDLAVVSVPASQTRALGSVSLRFADSTSVAVGQDAWTLGFPLSMGTTPRLAAGIVNSLAGMADDPRVLQISNPIQPGNSGGPLFNRRGELIGVVVSGLSAKAFLESAGIVPQNVNFAVKATLLQNLLETQALWARPQASRPSAVRTLPLDELAKAASPFVGEVRNYSASRRSAAPPTVAPAPEPPANAAPAGPVIVVETSRGVFEFETYPAEAPKTVARILELVKQRFYTGQRIHRVVPGFVIQWGDPQTRDMTKKDRWGTGGSGKPIGVAEITKTRTHVLGAVAMAHAGDPAKADSQMYVTLAPVARLNGQYTVFGKIISGMDVVQKIQAEDVVKRMTIK